MAEQTVRVPDDSANLGKRMRTFENTVSSTVVQSEAVTLVDEASNLLAKAEDTASASGHPGIAPLFIRRDDASALAATTDTDGDYTMGLADNKGRQKVTITGEHLTSVTGNLTAGAAGVQPQTASTTSAIVAAVPDAGNATLQVSGTYGAGTILIFESSSDGGTTWNACNAWREDNMMLEQSTRLPANTQRQWTMSIPGMDYIRVRCSTFVSGTIAVRINPGGVLLPEPSVPQPVGRVSFQAGVQAGAFAAVEAIVGASAIVPQRDFVAGAGAQSITVTAGKRLRLTGMMLVVRATSTTSAGGTIKLRVNPTGAAIVTSPVVAELAAGLIGTQVAQISTSAQINWGPDGPELADNAQFTFTEVGIATASVFDVIVHGYEY